MGIESKYMSLIPDLELSPVNRSYYLSLSNASALNIQKSREPVSG